MHVSLLINSSRVAKRQEYEARNLKNDNNLMI
jgi:hypothetical protein